MQFAYASMEPTEKRQLDTSSTPHSLSLFSPSKVLYSFKAVHFAVSLHIRIKLLTFQLFRCVMHLWSLS